MVVRHFDPLTLRGRQALEYHQMLMGRAYHPLLNY
jgi:hypothetical protein